jgi:peptide-methionine (S)-S-oxide reductase
MASRRRGLLLGTLAAAASTVWLAGRVMAGSEARAVPAYAGPVEKADGAATSEVAVLAGGCFWGVQAVYQHVKGVRNAVSGYAGGEQKSASYDIVGRGMSGHAEAVQVSYDPRQVSYAQLLQIFFSVAHDPTQLNRQGPDVGTQYRSAVFPLNDAQARIARAYVEQLDKAGVFRQRIATRVETGRAFFPAEDYHQDFLARNPSHPYIVINDLPKIEDLKRLLPQVYQATPVLVAMARKAG